MQRGAPAGLLALGVALLAAAGPRAAATAAARGDAHPVTKVINLLESLKAKVQEEGKQEALAYEKFQHWCQNSLKTYSAAITEEQAGIDALTGKIQSGESEQEALKLELKNLEGELLKLSTANTAAEKERNDARAIYETSSADLKATIAAVEQAISTVSAGANAASLLELRRLQATLAASDSAKYGQVAMQLREAVAQPELQSAGDFGRHIQTYDFKSGGVVELLKKLKLQFEDDLTAADAAETKSLNEYTLAKQARDLVEKSAQASKSEKDLALSDTQTNLAAWKGDLKNVREDFTADSGARDSTVQTCSTRASEWEERSKVRAGEIEAIDAAKQILAQVTGVSTEAPKNPVLPPSPLTYEGAASLLQVRSEPASDPRMKAINLLRSTAQVTHSKALARLAETLALHAGDPFKEVNNNIEKLIFRLMDEQKGEDEHKNWCDQEVSKTNASQADKEGKILELTGHLELEQATLQQLVVQVSEADNMVAEITRFMEVATSIRATGKAENEKALQDAQDAQAAIAQAISVLQAFYKKSGKIGDAFLQQGLRAVEPITLPDQPSTWASSYTGLGDPKAQPSGIVAILEGTAAEFAKMEADTRAQEATDESEYQEEMQASKVELARRRKESEMKGAEKKSVAEKISIAENGRKALQGELELVRKYYEELRPACLDGDSTYEDRKAARTAEIDALRQAQDLLEDAFREKPASLAQVQAARRFLEVRPHEAS